MKIHAFEAFFADPDKIADPGLFCDDIKRKFSEFRAQHLFTSPQKPTLYLMEIQTGKTSFNGLVLIIDFKEMEDNILKHEVTKVEKETEVMRFLKDNKAMVKPVMLASEKDEVMEEIITKYKSKKPDFTYTFEEEIHHFRKLNQKDTRSLIRHFDSNGLVFYIADGHHRFSTMGQLLEEGHTIHAKGILSVLFTFDQLSIKSFTRVVKSPNDFLPLLKKFGTIRLLPKARIPSNNKDIHFFYKGKWRQFIWKEKLVKQHQALLNVELFSEIILKNVFDIANERTSPLVEYLEGNVNTKEIEERAEKDKVYFTFKPISKSQFKKIVESGTHLPPKATWFFPRIKSGLINAEL